MPTPPSRPTMERRLLRHEAHDAIRTAILDGSFAPGEKLEDQALQRWLGISRTPIRDALNTLAAEGLVEIHAQSHTSVIRPDPAHVEDASQSIGVMMGGLTRITVPALNDEDLKACFALIDTALAAMQNRDQRKSVSTGLKLYERLISRCPNPALVKLVQANLTTLAYQIQVTADVREPNWELLIRTWRRLRVGLEQRNPIIAELAIEEAHRLPVPGEQWPNASWTPQ